MSKNQSFFLISFIIHIKFLIQYSPYYFCDEQSFNDHIDIQKKSESQKVANL